jgi:hypothetical protein
VTVGQTALLIVAPLVVLVAEVIASRLDLDSGPLLGQLDSPGGLRFMMAVAM